MKQCEIQKATSKEQIESFAKAYLEAKQLAADEQRLKNLTDTDVESLILDLGELVEKGNEKGFREVPVTFQNGSRALDADKIQHAIKTFSKGFRAFLEVPEEDERFNITMLYQYFEQIHPFEDGNGRAGDLLWKILKTRKDGKWPEELPPDIFSEKNNNKI